MSTEAPEHSRLSPSKGYQWTVCTASIPFAEASKDRLPPETPSAVAIEGTKAHNVCEALLKGKQVPKYATKDMKHYAELYADFCRETMGPKTHVYDWGVEHRVPLYYLPKEKGTVDFFCVNKKGIHLIDFKYGYDEVVSFENLQMAIYAMSLIEENKHSFEWPEITDSTPVTMTIIQPRINKGFETWTISVGDLRRFVGERVTPMAVSILAGHAGVFSPSEKVCKYCRALAICKARDNWLLSDFEEEVGDFIKTGDEILDKSCITDGRLIEIYMQRGRLEQWIKGIVEYVEGKVKNGTPMRGLKTVLSKGGHRYWSDEERAKKILLELGLPFDEVITQETISPAQAEKKTKAVKSKKLPELYRLMVKPRGSPIVVPENDPRPSCKDDVLDDFKDDDEEVIW